MVKDKAEVRSHTVCMASDDNAAIKADFEELYRIMNDKPLKEIDEIIYAVCTLCM